MRRPRWRDLKLFGRDETDQQRKVLGALMLVERGLSGALWALLLLLYCLKLGPPPVFNGSGIR